MRILNEQGSALIMVLLVVVIASIVGVAILSIGVNEDVQVSAEKFNMQAYYIARAGAESMAEYLHNFSTKGEADNFIAAIDGVLSDDIGFANGTANVTVTDEPGDEALIVATSVLASDFSGEAKIQMEYTTDEELYFWTEKDLDPSKLYVYTDDPPAVLSSNGTVTEAYRGGDEALFNSDAGQDPYETIIPDNINGYLEADVTIANNETGIFNGSTFEWGEYDDIAEEFVTSEGVYSVNTNSTIYDPETDNDISIDTYYIGELNMSNGSAVVINCETSDVNIVVDQMEMKDSVIIQADADNDYLVRIFVIGDGSDSTVDLNIQTPLEVNTDSEGTIVDPSKLRIYLNEGVKMNYIANGVTGAMIYGPDAYVEFGSNVEFEGTITVEEFVGQGQPKITIRPPEGNLPEFSRYLIKQWID